MRHLLIPLLLLGCDRPPPSASAPPPAPDDPPVVARTNESGTPLPRRDPDRPVLDPQPEPPDLGPEALFARGDALAKAGDTSGALAWWRWAFVYSLPEIRGLAFKHPVQARFMARPDLEARMRHEIDKEWPGQALEADRLGWVAHELIPTDLDLKQLLVDLYTEQVAGFYDPDSKDLYLVGEAPKAQRGWWETLLGGGADEQRLILAHELAHALADQHFDLFSLHSAVKADDDMALALSGLIEGEAMVVMVLTLLDENEQAEFLYTPPAFLSAMMELVVPVAASFAGGDSFARAPEILKQMLMLPYTRGMRFVMEVMQEGEGWRSVNAAFRDPPISTEQLLHPEKYLTARDEPTALTLPSDPPPGLEGFEQVNENTLGELGIRIRLAEGIPLVDAADAAEGWDGDTWRLYRRGEDLMLLWATTWDSEEEAVEFEEALLKAASPTEQARWPSGRIWRAGWDVFLVAGAPEDGVDAVAE